MYKYKKINDEHGNILHNASSDIRALCIKYDWYTSGTINDYSKLLKSADEGTTITELALDIAKHSSGVFAFDVSKKINELISNKPWLVKDSIKDEASLTNTINALINDEKAAIDAYDVAIKNLEGSIDDTSKQVLINIMKDERRHVENLYAVLNGQVTEKNLEDSIHDAVKSPSAYVNTR